jgi:hypothetical protein
MVLRQIAHGCYVVLSTRRHITADRKPPSALLESRMSLIGLPVQ